MFLAGLVYKKLATIITTVKAD
ncbi:hypothetical protein VcPa08_03570, partial [Vibrio cholerae]